MSGRRLRKTLLFLLLVGAGYWYFVKRPTLSGIVESLTRPIAGSKTAVKESERNRVNESVAPVLHQDLEVPLGAIQLNMTYEEVRRVLGVPERIEEYTEEGRSRRRWHYPRAERVVVFEEGRVLSIAIR